VRGEPSLIRRRSGWAVIPLLAVLMMGATDSAPLIEAVKSSDRAALRTLIKQGADINGIAGDGSTALHWASYRDDLESADLLIRAGANANAANALGATPLWIASENKNASIVRSLLAAGASPNAALVSGETVLMMASRSGNADIVEQLAAKGADVNVRATRGQTPLMWAAAQKHSDVTRVLLAHGADVHARSEAWSQVMAVPPHVWRPYNRAIPHGNSTALLFAARVGDLESAKMLVAAGANVNDEDAWGVSATVLAAHSGFGDLVDFLLETGADPNTSGAGFTALHAAILRRDERSVSALLARGANPNATLRVWTPTRRSSDDFHFHPAWIGATPLWLASRFSEAGIMRLLVKHGADPLFVHKAEYRVSGGPTGTLPRAESTTTLLAALGMGGGTAFLQSPDRSQREAQALDAVKLAVELGVDVNAANIDGRTALDAAKALKYESVAAFLEQKGAKQGTAGQPRRAR
jgi:ankyrin repeat protein